MQPINGLSVNSSTPEGYPRLEESIATSIATPQVQERDIKLLRRQGIPQIKISIRGCHPSYRRINKVQLLIVFCTMSEIVKCILGATTQARKRGISQDQDLQLVFHIQVYGPTILCNGRRDRSFLTTQWPPFRRLPTVHS